jgi:hypothetical protein
LFTPCQLTVRQKFPISFSTQEYSVLYNIQKLPLYAGKELKDIFQINDIVRGFLVCSLVILYSNDDKLRYNFIKRFFKRRGLSQDAVPKNFDELVDAIKLYVKDKTNLIISHLKDGDFDLVAESMKKIKTDNEFNAPQDRYKPEEVNPQLLDRHEGKKRESNYIMVLEEAEFKDFNKIREIIIGCLFKEKRDVSLTISELVRETLSFLFLTEDKEEDPYQKRMDFLGSLYVGCLYNLKPRTSLQLLFHVPRDLMEINLEPGESELLKWLDRDMIIFEAFKKEVAEVLENQSKNIRPKLRRGNSRRDMEIPGFSNNMKNINEWHGKYKSSVTGFSFVSAILGIKLMMVEWETKRHDIPIISALAFGSLYKESGTIDYGNMMDQRAFIVFKEWISELFGISKQFRESGGFE